MIDKSYIDRLKAIPITAYLADQGFVPAKQVGNQLVYLSPLTGEKTPSFFVHPDRNVFHCFSSGHKGDIITLVRQLEQLEFQKALLRLSHFSSIAANSGFTQLGAQNQVDPHIQAQKKAGQTNPYPNTPSNQIEILAVKTLSNRVLINYLYSRGISDQLATLYLKEAYFRVQGKNLFALALENDKGGYELRNPFYKGCALVKSPTKIAGKAPTGEVNLFEGFFDFLSALTYYKLDALKNDTIILNSLWLFESTYQQDLLASYSGFNLFLDNDRAGWKKAIEFRNLTRKQTGFKNKAVNLSSLYKGYKDFNQYLTTELITR